MKRFIVIIMLSALLICLSANVKAKADGITGAYDVLARSPGIDVTSIYYAYEQLNSEQKSIAHYIMGAYNNMYLTARGFSYDITYSQSAVMEEFKSLGSRVFNFAFSNIGWRSRVNEVFRQYMSGAIIYASQINTSFQTWYNNLLDGTIPELFIPYAKDAFDAWTNFYNDPSGDGIATFGDIISAWNSGNMYDLNMNGKVFLDSNTNTKYNNFILNNSPVIFSDLSNGQQLVLQGTDGAGNYFDSLFIQRSGTDIYSSFRFGYSDFTLANYSANYIVLYSGNRFVEVNGPYSNNINSHVYNGYSLSLQDLILKAFDITPYNYFTSDDFVFYYPYIEHVYLVDNLYTLSNPEELHNLDSLNVVKPSDNRIPYIITPNDRLLFTTRPVGYDDPLGFWDIIKDNSYDPETLQPASDDDFRQDIVNNTVINNYYVTDTDKINVPVEWFENDYSDQLANDSIPFLSFAKDCIDTLGDLQVYLYGAIVFGLGGGILKKFLL